ncbi:hypothetical protein [Yersinia phage fHe-Yen9-03]|uniref:Uncharacterized protein n=1 Tax=Yersinia phage fHe-Yen9-03 TaxID=2052743 RepID=A0A2C9CYA2_9CAUD|nr:hypothetical protein [Yersinia phage fHe-Yen9-03]
MFTKLTDKINRELLRNGTRISRETSDATITIGYTTGGYSVFEFDKKGELIDHHYSFHLNYAYNMFKRQCKKYL